MLINILKALGCFAVMSGILGLILAFASKLFAVKTNEKAEAVGELLPGANCGGCGYAGCAALAEAIAEGKAPINACNSASADTISKIAAVMGAKDVGKTKRMRAQVMCSGTNEIAEKKYIYAGIADCASAAKLAGGDKMCAYGCVGLGTCASVCKFDAIHIINGVAAVDYEKCTACGACVKACPKSIIRLIPYDAKHWVGCSSTDKGAVTKSYCKVGCIGCRICEKNCPSGAITVTANVASINYDLCTGCGICAEKCPRKIIWSARSQSEEDISKLKRDLSV